MKYNIPEHKEGVKTDTVSSIKFPSETEAIIHYQFVKQRFLNINYWHNIAGKATAYFTLTNEKGRPVYHVPQMNDHFKISIPAPENNTGAGYDWVQIKNIREQSEKHFEIICMTVQPASNPLNAGIEKAHFFNSGTSSTFLIKREVNITQRRAFS